ncbi:hypothetical protein ACHEXK_11080 [Limnohabitans sp. DCL3]|uniref:hypothetical protein n=1 Tax=Limnohabitans sp. DCL3 TaxID=3374103 RepID=UPI003A86F796
MTFDSALFDPKQVWVYDLKVLDNCACALWAEKVLALRAHWTHRHTSMPFYTLGMAAYLDAVASSSRDGGKPLYYSPILRRHHNQQLQDHFGDLLSLACLSIGEWTQKRGFCDPLGSALPGFHIHLAHPVFTQPVASKHRDLQFQLVFPDRLVTSAQVLTFTLPLSLPEGSGLNLWPAHHENDPAKFHLYKLGHMTLHSGLMTHQAVLFPREHHPPRIMLQGHALIEGDNILLYW